jgi:hypothetical protein
VTALGKVLKESRAAQAAEIAFVFLLAFAVVFVGWRVVGRDLFARQAVVWVVNLLMLGTVWIGLTVPGRPGSTLAFVSGLPVSARSAVRC